MPRKQSLDTRYTKKSAEGNPKKGTKSAKIKRLSKRGMIPFPDEVLPLIFSYFTWRDTYRVGSVCKTWHTVHRESLAEASITWKSSVFEGSSWQEILNQLQPTHECFASPTVPHIAFVVVSGESQIFRRINGWKNFFDITNTRCLLPLSCHVVSLYSDAGVIGSKSSNGEVCELEPDAIDEGCAMSITIGHLPDTDITLLTPEKEDITESMRDINASTPPSECAGLGLRADSTTSCIVLSTNGRQSGSLVRCLTYLHPSLAFVGAIFPFTDRCIPLAYRASYFVGRSWQSIVQQATNLLVGFSGRVQAVPFVSLGYSICSPILQCANVSQRRHPHFDLLHMYDAVNQVGSQIQVHPLSLINGLSSPSGSLHLFISSSLDEMRAFLADPSSMSLPSLECIYDAHHRVLFSQSFSETHDDCWPIGSYGVFCIQDEVAARSDFNSSLLKAKNTIQARRGEAVGALTFPCAARGEAFYNEVNVEGQAFRRIFTDIPLAGAFAGGEIGPMAKPGGNTSAAPQLQQFTTCGAVFYAV